MRHVRLVAKEDVPRIRHAARATHSIETPAGEFHFIETGTRPRYPIRRGGLPQCRCCGYPIRRDELGYFFRYYWPGETEYGGKLVWIHVSPCEWGEAHEKEPPDRTPKTRRTPKQKAKFLAGRLKPMTEQEKQAQREYGEKCGPVSTRQVDPAQVDAVLAEMRKR